MKEKEPRFITLQAGYCTDTQKYDEMSAYRPDGDTPVVRVLIGHSDEEMNESVINEANRNIPDLNVAKTYYRFPKLALSRDKMSLITDKYKTKNTRKKDVADIWIISNKYLESLYESTWNVNLITPKDLNFIVQKHQQFCSDEFLENVKNLIDETPEDYYFDVQMDFHGYNYYGTQATNPKLRRAAGDEFSEISQLYHRAKYMTEGYMDHYQELRANSDKVTTDIVMNDLASEDSVGLDYEAYKQIETMLKGDNNDQEVALTLMSNCKIGASKTWLGFLLYDHTYTLRGLKGWNQVAFKTLKKKFSEYIDASGTGWGNAGPHAISRLAVLLERDDAMSAQAVELLRDRMFQSIESHIANTNFTIERDNVKYESQKAEKSVLV